MHSVINALKSRVKKDEIPAFKYIELNGMKMTDPTQAYQLLWEKLTGSRVSAQHAMDLLDKRFSSTVDNIQPWYLIA